MLIIKFILKFVKILNKDATPAQIAGGIALGSIAGITPVGSLHNLVVLVLVLMLKVNFSSALLGFAAFKAFSYILDPLFNNIGYALLVETGSLAPLWTSLYNTPFVSWSKFNNTLTLGSLVFSLCSFVPLFLLLKWFVTKYREVFLAKIQKMKILHVLKATKLYKLYDSYTV